MIDNVQNCNTMDQIAVYIRRMKINSLKRVIIVCVPSVECYYQYHFYRINAYVYTWFFIVQYTCRVEIC